MAGWRHLQRCRFAVHAVVIVARNADDAWVVPQSFIIGVAVPTSLQHESLEDLA